jgi:hypothetical protein
VNILAQYLETVELGALCKSGVAQLRATKPWRISSEPYTGAGIGNIADFSTLEDMAQWTLGDTPADAAKRLKWHKIQDGDKTLLICDRVILVNVSWNDLNSQGLIMGKDITIDGQSYKARVMTAGNNYRSGSDNYSGGTPINNEWDRFVTREESISGLPVPISSDLDSTLNSTDKNSAHNQFWNWMGVYSWGQETYTGNGSSRALRGYYSARYWNYTSVSYRDVGSGWRPVLEILNSAPLISGQDGDLGEKNSPFEIIYNVSDPDGDTINVVEKLNGNVINTRTNVQQNVDLNISIDSATFQGLELNQQHTIIIEATDSENHTATRTHTFTKTASPVVISGEDTNLEGKWKPFTLKYQVSDLNGKMIDVTEKINGNNIRVVSSAPQNTDIELSINDVFEALELNREHIITINAVNTDGAIATRTFTFTKIDDRLKFTLKTPIQTSEAASKIVLSLVESIPDGTTFTARATNNGFDESPIWEDITEKVENRQTFYFTNAVKTSESWGVNIEIEILKNNQSQPIWIDGFGVSFE